MKPIESKQRGVVAVDNRSSAGKTPPNSAEIPRISHWAPYPPPYCVVTQQELVVTTQKERQSRKGARVYTRHPGHALRHSC